MFKTPTRPPPIRRATLRLHGETIAHLTLRQLHEVVGGLRDTELQCTSMATYCPVSQVGLCDPKSDACQIG
ncbi:MAG: hypothetical protein ABIY55_25685 [Kofleriaceae bacterium]